MQSLQIYTTTQQTLQNTPEIPPNTHRQSSVPLIPLTTGINQTQTLKSSSVPIQPIETQQTNDNHLQVHTDMIPAVIDHHTHIEHSKQFLIYIGTVYYYCLSPNAHKKYAVQLCQELVTKYCVWIEYIRSFGMNGDWYLEMLIELLVFIHFNLAIFVYFSYYFKMHITPAKNVLTLSESTVRDSIGMTCK